MIQELEAWSASYEQKTVLLLSLGFGLVGFDRFMILPLFPVMKTALHLSYGDLGIIIGVLSIAWGASSITAGRLADRFGRRRVLVVSLLSFSLLAGFTGLAASLTMLLVMRAVMGFAEGAVAPASIVATLEAAKPDRQASMLGLQQAAMPLSSFLRFDPWTDQVVPMHSSFEPILSSADKMPFEVTPIYFKLQRYDAAAAAAAMTPAGMRWHSLKSFTRAASF